MHPIIHSFQFSLYKHVMIPFVSPVNTHIHSLNHVSNYCTPFVHSHMLRVNQATESCHTPLYQSKPSWQLKPSYDASNKVEEAVRQWSQVFDCTTPVHGQFVGESSECTVKRPIGGSRPTSKCNVGVRERIYWRKNYRSFTTRRSSKIIRFLCMWHVRTTLCPDEYKGRTTQTFREGVNLIFQE